MKTIQFTDEEIEDFRSLININNYTISSVIRNKFKMAALSTEGSVISDDEHDIISTPAKAIEKVSERKQAAREANEKEAAKRMISELTIKCESYEGVIEAFEGAIESMRLDTCVSDSKIKHLEKENEKATVIIQGFIDDGKVCSIYTIATAKDFINNKLF